MRADRRPRAGREHRRRLGSCWLPALLAALLPPWLGAAELGPVFRSLSVAEGLPDRRVEAIVQDTHGYIWIGTRGGLVRHEGDRMRFIPGDPESPEPLPGRNIMSLMAHSDGSVWAAVENRGVVQIGPDLRLRRHLESSSRSGRLPAGNIWSMTEDCNGRVWMAFMRGGVAAYDPAADALETFPQTETAGLDPDGFQVHLETDSACRVWLVQTSRVSVHEAGGSAFRPVHTSAPGAFSMTLAEAAGRIYFNEGGALYDLGPTAAAPAARPETLLEIDGLITGIAADPHSGELIVASTAGVYRKPADPSGALRSIRYVPGLANGLPSDTVDGVLFDREGGLWLTTTRSGAAYLPPGSAAFERYQPVPGLQGARALNVEPVMSLSRDEPAAGFWVGGQRGELEFLPLGEGDDAPPVISAAAREALSGSAVLDIRREEDALYVATQTKVLRIGLGPQAGHELLMRRVEIDAGTFAQLRRKDAGQLWIVTQDVGLFLLNEETGQSEHFHPGGEGRYRLPETAPGELMIGPDGRWWLQAPGGLYLWEEEGGFQALALPDTEPFSAAAWQAGDLWLATDQSLQLWRKADQGLEKEREVPLRGRLPPGRTIAIVPDALGQLWLLRTSGLSLYRVAEDRVRHLSQQDGLAAVEFGENTAVSLPDGRLAFGGRGGIVTVDPGRVGGVTVAPEVHVVRLQAGDRIFELGPDDSETVELEHDHDSLFVDFLATSYLAPERTRYRVRLEGWDSEWIRLIGQTRHHYSNLPSGNYRFQVQAAAPDGPWSEQGDALAVTIRRPPWLGRWALGAYALLAVTGAGIGLRGYRRANQRRREVDEARQKRALAEEQRQIITRLNHSLEPMTLAETIAREIARLTGASVAWLGYVEEHLPRELACTDASAKEITREQWRRRIDAVDRVDDLALSLRVADREVARVLVERPAADFADLAGEGRERLRLLEEMAGQTLHNALLLQRVRALADRAEQASNAKSQFLATMSHEIRTPLHGVLGMVELLRETETEPGQQDILDTLRQSGLQLQRIIDDVLDISRIEAGRMPLSFQPFDLASLLEQVVDLHAPNAAKKGLDLRLRMAAALPLVATGDSDRLSQVLGNLLNNAVKFTEQGGIELSASLGRDGQLVLIVSDSGPGIGEADRERLFEPFTQLDASITRSYSGSGLGLAICRRLVDAMGGRLDLLEGCHRGSRFRVRLPAPAEPLAGKLSTLLEGQLVAASVSAPTLRILRGLARRWGIRVVDARGEPRACDLLLVDPLTLDEADAARLDRWCRCADALAWLQSPFSPRAGSPPTLPEDAYFLRWPLVESRFVGLLFDLRMG